ncbi:MAG: GntR family transcriptional regulator [Kiritimatiellales bacterium]|nr:GntR family transcriptional regulator [Kiritimatiellales bacterium]
MKQLETVPHKYQEIRDHILARIESGELKPGTRLPGVRALGKEFDCNYHTVRHAFEELAEQGYVLLKRGSGTFVTDRAAAFQKSRVEADKVLRTTDQLGVLLPLSQWGYYVTSLIDQLHRAAAAQNLKLNIRTVTEIDIKSASLARELHDQDCCAIILPWIGGEQDASDLHDFVRASELPVVLGNPAHGLEANCYRDPKVDLDAYHTSTTLQCRYFQALGYENIALLGPTTAAGEYFQRKLLQYSRWICQENMSSLIGLVDGTPKDFDRVIERWSAQKGKIAVIAYHDELAFKFMDACRWNGISIPADFALIAHNNDPSGLRSDPPLSSMLCPYNYIAAGMIAHALALSRGESAQCRESSPQSFVIRESCGGRMRRGSGIHGVVKALMDDFYKNEETE